MQTIKSIDINGRRARLFIEGDASQPTILLLHGIGRSFEDWEPQFVPFRQAGYRVIAPDLPGSGFSDRLPAPTTLPGLAQGVLEILGVIGETRRLHVMRHSMGGAVALQLLTLDPNRVATLNLVGSAGFGPKSIRYCDWQPHPSSVPSRPVTPTAQLLDGASPFEASNRNGEMN